MSGPLNIQKLFNSISRFTLRTCIPCTKYKVVLFYYTVLVSQVSLTNTPKATAHQRRQKLSTGIFDGGRPI